jgi:Protein of unknown function (DUF3223)
MPAKPISLGTLYFARKGDAAAHLKAMLHRYDVGDKVSADDAQVLMAAVAHHPDAAAKMGCGISHFSVRSADYGTKCFWLNRTDGTTEKFSYISCIYG